MKPLPLWAERGYTALLLMALLVAPQVWIVWRSVNDMLVLFIGWL